MTRLSPDQVPENWSRIAESYEHWFEPLTRRYAEEAFRRLALRPGKRVLDVAAGTGAFSLAAARAGCEVTAIDFAPGMVERLRGRSAAEGIARLSAELMDGQALALPDDAFDAGASVLGLVLFPDIDRGLSELRRVVRPGGRVAIVSWGRMERFEPMILLKRAMAEAAPDFEMPSETPVWARVMGEAGLRDRLTAAGLRDVTVSLQDEALPLDSAERFWHGFTRTIPPLAPIFERLGPERTDAVGEAFIRILNERAGGGTPTVGAEACIGVGVV